MCVFVLQTTVIYDKANSKPPVYVYRRYEAALGMCVSSPHGSLLLELVAVAKYLADTKFEITFLTPLLYMT